MAKKVKHSHETELFVDWHNNNYSLLPHDLMHIIQGKDEDEAKKVIADKYGGELYLRCRKCLMKGRREVDFHKGRPQENPGAKHEREFAETLNWVVDEITKQDRNPAGDIEFKNKMQAAMERTERTLEAHAKANKERQRRDARLRLEGQEEKELTLEENEEFNKEKDEITEEWAEEFAMMEQEFRAESEDNDE